MCNCPDLKKKHSLVIKISFFPKKYQLKILLIPNQTKAGKQKKHMKSLNCYQDKNNYFTQILV